MSERRIPDLAFSRRNAREKGKILHNSRKSVSFEIYGAYQFSEKCHTDGRNFFPKVPVHRLARDAWFASHYRLRINGTWHRVQGHNYSFITLPEAMEMVFRFQPLSTP